MTEVERGLIDKQRLPVLTGEDLDQPFQDTLDTLTRWTEGREKPKPKDLAHLRQDVKLLGDNLQTARTYLRWLIGNTQYPSGPNVNYGLAQWWSQWRTVWEFAIGSEIESLAKRMERRDG